MYKGRFRDGALAVVAPPALEGQGFQSRSKLRAGSAGSVGFQSAEADG